jgi:hypothetical protein
MRAPGRSGLAVLNNMCIPPYTKVKSVQYPVGARLTMFSLAHACLAEGLIEYRLHPVNWRALSKTLDNTWARSVPAFFDAMAAKGITHASIDRRAAQLTGCIIGWRSYYDGNTISPLLGHLETYGVGICPDLELTLAILSRSVAYMFIARRTPDYEWRTLTGNPLCVCDDRFSAPGINEEPWGAYARAFDRGLR